MSTVACSPPPPRSHTPSTSLSLLFKRQANRFMLYEIVIHLQQRKPQRASGSSPGVSLAVFGADWPSCCLRQDKQQTALPTRTACTRLKVVFTAASCMSLRFELRYFPPNWPKAKTVDYTMICPTWYVVQKPDSLKKRQSQSKRRQTNMLAIWRRAHHQVGVIEAMTQSHTPPALQS